MYSYVWGVIMTDLQLRTETEYSTEFEIINLNLENYCEGNNLEVAIRFIDEKLDIDTLLAEEEKSEDIDEFDDFDCYMEETESFEFPYSDYVREKGMFLLPNKWVNKYKDIFEKHKHENVSIFLKPYIPQEAIDKLKINFNEGSKREYIKENKSGNRTTSFFRMFDEKQQLISDVQVIRSKLQLLKCKYNLQLLGRFNFFFVLNIDFGIYKEDQIPKVNEPGCICLHYGWLKKDIEPNFNEITKDIKIYDIPVDKEDLVYEFRK